jgi:hypothetical protein
MVDIVIKDKVVVNTSEADLETAPVNTPASMSGDTGITGRLDLRWNLAGQKQLTFTV